MFCARLANNRSVRFVRLLQLVLALEVMDREAHPLGLTINWAKTKIQNLGDLVGVNQMHYATVQGNQVEVVESFTAF